MFFMLGGGSFPAGVLVGMWLNDGAGTLDGLGCGADTVIFLRFASGVSVATPGAESSELKPSSVDGTSPCSATGVTSVRTCSRAPSRSWDPSNDELRRRFCLLRDSRLPSSDIMVFIEQAVGWPLESA